MTFHGATKADAEAAYRLWRKWKNTRDPRYQPHWSDFSGLVMKHADLKVVNCYKCGELLAGRQNKSLRGCPLRALTTWVKRRPVCIECQMQAVKENPNCEAAKQFPKPPEDVGRDDFDLEDVA